MLQSMGSRVRCDLATEQQQQITVLLYFFIMCLFPEYSLEELMLKLKLQYVGHLMLRVESLENTLMLGKIEGRRRRG